jgi:hypothetical protein
LAGSSKSDLRDLARLTVGRIDFASSDLSGILARMTVEAGSSKNDLRDLARFTVEAGSSKI